jgi:asparagine synthase (glutamine-hydrolysing)
MCGIVGQYHLGASRLDPLCVYQAAYLIKHRGPNSEGYLVLNTTTGQSELRNGPDTAEGIDYPPIAAPVSFAPDLVLSQRRLSILDLSPKGHEPMALAGRDDLWITFNGELYNYLEVRAELQAKGRVFTTECDVEVLLHAYDEWGVDCLDRFLGMFAFALWDQQRQRLWCARDRFGIKPFYYAVSENRFSFASELKALRILAPEACAPDMTQVFWALQFNAIFNPPQTFFAGVRELPGGCSLVIDHGVVAEPRRWYTLSLDKVRSTYDYSDPAAEFLRLMQDSVRLHLRSDVPVGTCLSGGLDSSTIVALATSALNGGHMNSFSVVYPVAGYDETRFVNLVSERFHTIKHVATPEADADFFAHLSKIVWHQDVPVTSTGLTSQNAVMRMAAGNVTVLLDGQGSDELMAGYLSHAVYYYRTLLRTDPLRWASNFPTFALEAWQRYLPGFTFREFMARASHLLLHGRDTLDFLAAAPQAQAYQRETLRVPGSLPGADALNNQLFKSVTSYSIPTLLHYEDRSSMTYGIEARVPFLDHRLVEFALGIPAEQKIRGAEGKSVMRRAVAGVLPAEIAYRKDKLGYPTPFAAWSRGSLRAELNTFLEDRVFKRDWYDSAALRTIWQRHQAGTMNADRLIHNLVTTELWYDHFGHLN